MIVHILTDGEKLSGKNYQEIVEKLQKGSIHKERSNQEYMRQVKERLKITFGEDVKIEIEDEEKFILGLRDLELVEITL